MADVKFIEEASKLGIEITEAESVILAEELGIMVGSMETTAEIFKLKITNLISQLETRGLSNEQVVNVLLDDLDNDGAIFGGLKRQLIGDAESFVEVSGQRLTVEEFEIQTGEELSTWVAVLVNTCQDCLPRHGITKSFAEWTELGLPGTGWSRCRSKCQCQVFPASVVESKEELQAPVKRTKGTITKIAREKKKAGQIKSVPKYVNRKLGKVHNTKEPLRKEFRKDLPGFKR